MDVQNWNILLVNNNDDDYTRINALFRDIGHPYQLTWIDHDGFIADVACSGRFHTILLDNYLGQETGVQILDKIQNRGECAPIVLLTGSFFPLSENEVIEKGAYAVLNKKRLNKHILRDTVNMVINSYRPSNAWQPSYPY
jgi:two-component system, cell cycle sensor histidine kinase and response regulator CckA